MARLLAIVATFCLGATAQPQPGPKAQPLPFSHKIHAATGMKCVECHAMSGRGWSAGFPAESKCMACHIAIKVDSPHIQKLAAFQQQGQAAPWERVYKIPNYVYFSHKRHFERAKISCETCHGPVASRDVLVKEKSLTMKDCMACHEKSGASNGCDVCHVPHP
jgi:hypothetical protein